MAVTAKQKRAVWWAKSIGVTNAAQQIEVKGGCPWKPGKNRKK